MSSVKYNTAIALAEYLQPFVEDVEVIAQQQAYDMDVNFPCVVILPGRHTFTPSIFAEVNIEDDQKLLTRVGFMDGQTEIRVYSTDAPSRDLIEQRITEAFFAQDMLRPSVVVLETAPFNYGGVNWTNKAIASFDLMDTDWKEEMVFTDKRYSFINLVSQYQVFISSNVYTMQEIDVYIEDFSGQLIEEVKIL